MGWWWAHVEEQKEGRIGDEGRKHGCRQWLTQCPRGKGVATKGRLLGRAQELGTPNRKWLVLGNDKFPAGKHTGGEVLSGQSGSVEILKHDVRFPPTHKSDHRWVNIGP